MVTDGMIRRDSKVRLMRDSVVVHEGNLGTLRRFKDDVREVQNGYECGIALENYNDIQPGDVIECFEVQEIARHLEAS
jgi:translation initiation factor IF-2